jgi:trehalose 6-phosphate synthase
MEESMLTQLPPAGDRGPSESQPSKKLIMVSNRGPIEHWFDDTGRIRRRDAAGGVATALGSVAKRQPVTWIASAGTDADKAVGILGQNVQIGKESDLRLLALPDKAYESYYETFCNPILWFVQHSIGELLQSPDLAQETFDSWQDGYLPINQIFADAVINAMDGDGSDIQVMLHDYHLYLAPRLIRAARPRASLQHFVHIPWPGPAAWRQLPEPIVRRICTGLLANDSVVFQTDASVQNFLATCRHYLGERATVLERQGQVDYLGQTTFVWSNPVSLDVSELTALRASPLLEHYSDSLRAPAGVQTIVRVDRLDPSKNVADGFEAFDLLLERNPHLRGKVRFLAFLIPSRANIPEYADYTRRVFDLVDSINRKYGTAEWTPIKVFYEHNRIQALAALTMYDVLLVNSIADGMNLVAKEGSILNECNGVLALSVTAGAHEELRYGAVDVNPFDIVDTAAALEQALTLSPAEREQRAAILRDAVMVHQTSDWLRQQLKDLSISEHMKRIEASLTA